jgi:hypothetical protein
MKQFPGVLCLFLLFHFAGGALSGESRSSGKGNKTLKSSSQTTKTKSETGPFSSSQLSSGEVKKVNDSLKKVYDYLWNSGKFFFVNNWIFSGGCVDCSDTRGANLATLLPGSWEVRSYTLNSQLHTFNVLVYTDSTGKKQFFKVDNYYHAWPEISYIPDISKAGCYYNTQNSTFIGSLPESR